MSPVEEVHMLPSLLEIHLRIVMAQTPHSKNRSKRAQAKTKVTFSPRVKIKTQDGVVKATANNQMTKVKMIEIPTPPTPTTTMTTTLITTTMSSTSLDPD